MNKFMPVKFEYLCEIDKTLDISGLPKLIQEEIENLNSSVTQNKLSIYN